MQDKKKISVIGLGYVGLPLAVEFAKHYLVIGFDTNLSRIDNLKTGIDATQEISTHDLSSAEGLNFSSDPEDLRGSDFIIVTVPTPVDNSNRPEMSALKSASKVAGLAIGKGTIVVYESTVFPGATEEVCVPILESASGLRFNKDFFCGYSPERINPGDREHKLRNIPKITSGSTSEVAEVIDVLYGTIIDAGTHKARSIKVAEAAKVIENTQRDLNIALMNELALIFQKLGIDTLEVLEAAGTKWNFLPFRPGLVGGHCIGVDPYYLTHKAEQIGYHPEVILAGRKINDSIAQHIANRIVQLMLAKGIEILGAKVLVMGLTFKENCPDFRNTKVNDLVKSLTDYRLLVDIYDPWVNREAAEVEYGISCLDEEPCKNLYSAIILAVPHTIFLQHGFERIKDYGKNKCVVYDVKSALGKDEVDERL